MVTDNVISSVLSPQLKPGFIVVSSFNCFGQLLRLFFRHEVTAFRNDMTSDIVCDAAHARFNIATAAMISCACAWSGRGAVTQAL